MSNLEVFAAEVAADDVLHEQLKAAPDDASFVALVVAESAKRGTPVAGSSVEARIQADRAEFATMTAAEVERVASGRFGARLSGGHQSGNGPHC